MGGGDLPLLGGLWLSRNSPAAAHWDLSSSCSIQGHLHISQGGSSPLDTCGEGYNEHHCMGPRGTWSSRTEPATLRSKVKEGRRKRQGEEVCDPGEDERRETQEYSFLLACLMGYSSH